MRELIKKMLLETGHYVKNQNKNRLTVIEKSSNDFVTNVDREAASLLTRRIQEAYPDDTIICEDEPVIEKMNALENKAWLIDPLDGTKNYMHGYPYYGISICCYDFKKKKYCASAIYIPFFDQLFEAYEEERSTMNGEKLYVSNNVNISNCLILTGMSHKVDASNQKELEYFNRISQISAGTRRTGCAALDLCYVAAGFADAYYHFNLKPWDVAAGSHIVSNAGGVATNIGSENFDFYNRTILATNRSCHLEIQSELRKM